MRCTCVIYLVDIPILQAVPPSTRKYDLLGDDPELLFAGVDQIVLEVISRERERREQHHQASGMSLNDSLEQLPTTQQPLQQLPSVSSGGGGVYGGGGARKKVWRLKKVVKKLVAGIQKLPEYQGREELLKVRAFFKWVVESIAYDPTYLDRDMTIQEILVERKGVCKQYVKLFGEMCSLGNVRVKSLKGFAKGPQYDPGLEFVPGEGVSHAWNAVFIQGSWRLLDCTWGAGKMDEDGDDYVKETNEHYFLTDPDELIYSHFPYDEVISRYLSFWSCCKKYSILSSIQVEANYSRWQLLTSPISLSAFNTIPLLTPMFFEYSLRLSSEMKTPVSITESSEDIKIGAWEVIRYKYKFYLASEVR